MLSWEDYYKDEAPVKKEETNKPEPRLSEVTRNQNSYKNKLFKLKR